MSVLPPADAPRLGLEDLEETYRGDLQRRPMEVIKIEEGVV